MGHVCVGKEGGKGKNVCVENVGGARRGVIAFLFGNHALSFFKRKTGDLQMTVCCLYCHYEILTRMERV